MKKILFLTLIAGMAVSANAQVHSNQYSNHPTPVNARDRAARERIEIDRQIARINKDYDNRINAIQHQAFLRKKEKRQQIRKLEQERSLAIKACKDHYSASYASGYGHKGRR